jgi:hypothetical protein
MEYYLEHHGSLAVLIGTIVEGGTVLTMAEFMVPDHFHGHFRRLR